MRAWKISTLLVAMILAGLPLFAQAGGGRSSGSVPFGSRGYAWQTDIQLAKEELQEFEVGLQRMDKEEWMAEALAWVTYDYTMEKRLAVDESWRVLALDPGKRAEVEAHEADYEEEPTSWDIAWGKKGPKEMEVTLTDTNSTKVVCPLGSAEKLGKGYLGIFVREGVVLCMARGPFEEEAEGPA